MSWGIGEAIDRMVAQDHEKRMVSVSQAGKALVLNGLGFVNQRLIGGICPEHLNDDVTGRALERLYEHDVTRVYAQVASQAVRRLGLTPRFGHLDTRGFHVDGQYHSETPPEAGVIHITQGYSRDHRPDLKQVVLELIAENAAGISLWMEPLSGNSDDKTSLRATVKAHLGQLSTDEGLEYGVADNALCTAETLRELEGIVRITRMAETLSAAREAIQAAAPGLMVSRDKRSLPAKRRSTPGSSNVGWWFTLRRPISGS
jgi:transposase